MKATWTKLNPVFQFINLPLALNFLTVNVATTPAKF